MTLVREMNPEKTQYINSYLVAMTSNNKPVVGKTINYKVYNYRYDDSLEEVQSTATTDSQGQVRIDLSSLFLDETRKHQSYRLKAWFEPDENDKSLTPSAAPEYHAYVFTETVETLNREF